MSVIVVSQEPREGGMVDVTLAQDGVRFAVSVTQALTERVDAMVIYQDMADEMLRRRETLGAILTGPGMG